MQLALLTLLAPYSQHYFINLAGDKATLFEKVYTELQEQYPTSNICAQEHLIGPISGHFIRIRFTNMRRISIY